MNTIGVIIVALATLVVMLLRGLSLIRRADQSLHPVWAPIYVLAALVMVASAYAEIEKALTAQARQAELLTAIHRVASGFSPSDMELTLEVSIHNGNFPPPEEFDNITVQLYVDNEAVEFDDFVLYTRSHSGNRGSSARTYMTIHSSHATPMGSWNFHYLDELLGREARFSYPWQLVRKQRTTLDTRHVLDQNVKLVIGNRSWTKSRHVRGGTFEAEVEQILPLKATQP